MLDALRWYTPGFLQSPWLPGLLNAMNKMLSESQPLAELHEALNYELLVYVLSSEHFPVNEISKIHSTVEWPCAKSFSEC